MILARSCYVIWSSISFRGEQLLVCGDEQILKGRKTEGTLEKGIKDLWTELWEKEEDR